MEEILFCDLQSPEKVAPKTMRAVLFELELKGEDAFKTREFYCSK
jgi:hypothetical protein